MKHPGRTWWLFGAAATLLFVSVGWVSVLVLRLETAQWEAASVADREEKARLALWRMESWLATLMLEESARSPLQYAPFHSATRAYSRAITGVGPGEVLMPSPLLGHASNLVLIHFQIDAHDSVTSPQVPVGSVRELAERAYTDAGRVEVAAIRLARLQELLGAVSVAGSGSENNRERLRREARIEEIPPGPAAPVVEVPQPFSNRMNPADNAFSQAFLNNGELVARQNVARQSQAGSGFGLAPRPEALAFPAPTLHPRLPRAGRLQPAWLGDALFLVRGAEISGEQLIQGCWLDWPALRRTLLGVVGDLFPEAELEASRPAGGSDAAPDLRALASLPVRLVLPPAPSPVIPWATPVRVSLGIAWGCVLIATLAAAGLIQGVVRLSERRGAFVSAVTHELRSPLTTFRMYSEMLAADMVKDPVARQSYLETLCAESNRLGHLVENVLAFAGLERGSARRRYEDLPLGELLGRVWPRLEQRANQGGMTLTREVPEPAQEVSVRTDASTVEQILFNLVDNACKYAAGGVPSLLRVEVGTDPGYGVVRVRDHGPGVAPERVGRLFQPFNKTAHEAAVSAPGIGLGLALSRRLARSLGGDLWFESPVDGGACFGVRLPRTRPAGKG